MKSWRIAAVFGGLMGGLLCAMTPAAQAVDTTDLLQIEASKGTTQPGMPTVWFDVRELTFEGRGYTDTKSFFDRFPAKAEAVVRGSVWRLSLDSAGMAVRFVTDATQVSARWKLREQTLAMPHMAATGVSGVDLYAKTEDGKWQWLGVGRPTTVQNTQSIVSGLPPGTREFMLYLPLYNGVESVEIGLPPGTKLFLAPPRTTKPIVFYGTSITQGACASRPGMCYSAILGRWLDREAINLGFSGNAKMEPEVAKLLAELDPAVFFLNALPNMTAAELEQRAEPFVRTIRAAHPETPIVLVEDRTYANAPLVATQMQRNLTSRKIFRAVYEKLQSEGMRNLSYIPGDDQIGTDSEGTVDASHPSDLGFFRMAETFRAPLAAALKQADGK